MIPLWFWPALAIACLLVLAEWDAWRINRRRHNLRAVEAERIARENAHPLGSVDIWGWPR